MIGATSGIGRTIALGLAQHGANVVPTGRRAQLVEEVCAEVEAAGRQGKVRARRQGRVRSVRGMHDNDPCTPAIDILLGGDGNIGHGRHSWMTLGPRELGLLG